MRSGLPDQSWLSCDSTCGMPLPVACGENRRTSQAEYRGEEPGGGPRDQREQREGEQVSAFVPFQPDDYLNSTRCE